MDTRQKAKDLINLALDESAKGNEKERIVAAFKALKIISDNGLLNSPLDGIMQSDNETVQAAASIFEKLTDPAFVKSVKKVASGFGRGKRR